MRAIKYTAITMCYAYSCYHASVATSSLDICGSYWTISRVAESQLSPEDTAEAEEVSGRLSRIVTGILLQWKVGQLGCQLYDR